MELKGTVWGYLSGLPLLKSEGMVVTSHFAYCVLQTFNNLYFVGSLDHLMLNLPKHQKIFLLVSSLTPLLAI